MYNPHDSLLQVWNKLEIHVILTFFILKFFPEINVLADKQGLYSDHWSEKLDRATRFVMSRFWSQLVAMMEKPPETHVCKQIILQGFRNRFWNAVDMFPSTTLKHKYY